ncbi:family 78 glycoside hydrolase catalytic domain [Paenibacillus maysiensis]|uniref:family 78 glycoside hydrolase catalytic domain n=1 Tax=Paenibacillus maysiensis TaxID=1155954 RepID=UPI0004B9A979|nr:family 78 glycoside hydrolase catalytic domain [Paenibacillus maysiensis]
MFTINDFKIEYRQAPIGLDVEKPRFSWTMTSPKQEVKQQEYRMVVKANEVLVWDSGACQSDASHLVEYAGDELRPLTTYQVMLEVLNNYGEKASITSNFETGLMDYKNMKADWITVHNEGREEVPIFRKYFKVQGEVAKARIYASALGVYELSLNGNKVGDYYFTPGWTSYHHRIQYQAYDITELLKQTKEDNKLDMTVANGWFKGIFGLESSPNNYGDKIAAIAYVRVEYEDGSIEEFGTDNSWSCFTGETITSEMYLGECIDKTISETEFGEVELYSFPKTVLVAQENEQVKITKKIKPIKSLVTPKGETVIDFGQNMAGFVCCKLKQPKGTKITIKHAEVLDKEGNFYTENLRAAAPDDMFICSGSEDVFMPRFTFHGFRYIAIDGLVNTWDIQDFTACALHTDMEETGTFTCSNAKVNRLQKNIEWGQRSNFLDIPTDCPQRDERLGWTGDAQVFARTAAFNFNTALFFTKWLKDLSTEQTRKYGVPYIVPNILGETDAATGWGDAATIIPWTMYLVYGDRRILENQYESMKDWVEYIHSKTEGPELWQQGFQFGDWVALDKEEGSDRVGATDVYFIASAFYAYSTSLLIETAKILGKNEDAEKYQQLYERIITDFRAEYITQKGRLVSETQTGCILALHFDLAEEKDRPRILKSLVENLKRHDNHLVTGFLGTPYLCQTLSENGYHQLAGEVFLKEDFPSWLYTVNMGATTMWERWNSINPDGNFDESGMNSFNHYAYGSIGDWMYQNLAGIRLIEPAYKRFMIKPELIGGISWVEASFKSAYGRIKSKWSFEKNIFSMDVEVPVNTEAEIWLIHSDKPILVGSGSYHFEFVTGQSI